jgi:drug/metabolite transporter (DMT)-like permease
VRDRRILRADGLLLLTSLIWGLNFAAQRSGMAVIGPFAFSAARFGLGAASLVPLLLLSRRRDARREPSPGQLGPRGKLLWAALTGAVLFIASNLQQVGLVSTTAGNAGFITCLYVVLVPLFGLAMGRAPGARIWIGVLLALAGLGILTLRQGLAMAPGDGLELLGALFWAGHILLISRLVFRMRALELAVGQFAVCSGLSLAVALLREPAPFAGLVPAAFPILFGGLLSIGVAYTLQIVAQKNAHPAHASIILSMEALFAAIGGVVALGEPFTLRLAAGGALMLAGMVVSQLEPVRPETAPAILH